MTLHGQGNSEMLYLVKNVCWSWSEPVHCCDATSFKSAFVFLCCP